MMLDSPQLKSSEQVLPVSVSRSRPKIPLRQNYWLVERLPVRDQRRPKLPLRQNYWSVERLPVRDRRRPKVPLRVICWSRMAGQTPPTFEDLYHDIDCSWMSQQLRNLVRAVDLSPDAVRMLTRLQRADPDEANALCSTLLRKSFGNLRKPSAWVFSNARRALQSTLERAAPRTPIDLD